LIRRLLVPVDGSPASVRAAALAADLARAIGGEATLLHVYDRGGITALGLEALSAEEAEEEKLRLAGDVFEGALAPFRERGLAADRRVVLGLAAEEICGVARSGSYDLIVIGSRGASGRHFFTGSVSERVLQYAPCPVTVVR
jgi:nucleotide-binding universal stress UspA family protein